MKVGMSSFDVFAIARELQKLINARINKVYQISPQELKVVLNIKGFGNAILVIEAGKRIHLTEYPKPSPKKPSVFAMTLRKYIQGGVIKGISQVSFDRIVEIRISKKGEEYVLIAELFGKGNVILTDADYNILAVMMPKRYKHRELIIKAKYSYPPQKANPFELDKEKLRKIFESSSSDIVRTLASKLGLGGVYAEEVCLRAELNKTKKEPSEEELDRIIKILEEIKEKTGKENVIVLEKDKAIDVTPLKLELYKNKEFKEYESFNKALDEYFTKYEIEKIEELEKSEFLSEIEKLKARLKRQAKICRELRKIAKEYKELGDLIYLNFDKISKLLETINKARKKFSWEEISRKLGDKVKIDPEKAEIRLRINDKILKLDLRKSPSENADFYYNKSKKAKEKLEGAKKAILQTVEEIREVKRKGVKKKEKPKKIVRKKRKWYEKFRWFISSEGFLILGGRDATQNEILVKKHLGKEDIFVHADIHGAPAVIIKTEGKGVSPSTIQEAFDFAASYSRAWKRGIFALDVYWVKPEQVSKTPEHGEYLTKGAFVIRGKKNYGRGKVEIAIGFIINEIAEVIGGPPSAIESKTPYFVTLVPGRKKSKELAEEIKNIILSKVKEKDKEKVKNVEIEEIQRFLPAGGGEVKKG
ncbi:MAG: fibronectin-binding domain-containing protein [Candidatus Hydrothermarchaeota archaeon]|nr:MAG: fibronectin-binding domain-containing protein [Candidatus Hydrothermarchaeota archaeon]